MAFVDDKDGERRRKSTTEDTQDISAEKTSRKDKRAPIPEVGNALRSAYDQAVKEEIPAEMLALLGRLG